jgi:hypothetical protein
LGGLSGPAHLFLWSFFHAVSLMAIVVSVNRKVGS